VFAKTGVERRGELAAIFASSTNPGTPPGSRLGLGWYLDDAG
jgi:hypothetical protein